MFRLLQLVLILALSVCGRAQERHATVELFGGEVLVGTVVSIDLSEVQLRVGDTVHKLPSGRIRRCRIEEAAAAEGTGEPAPVGGAPEVAKAPASTGAADAPPVPEQAPGQRRPTWSGPLPDPIDPTAPEQVPHDLRNRSRLRQRLEVLDDAYPWLQPTAPVQWGSLSVLLWVLTSLSIYLSVHVAGGVAGGFGPCALLSLVYFAAALLQLALAPVHDLAVTLMLLANPTLALFMIRTLFGLSRGGTVIAFAVQIGFAGLAFGILELVTAVLGTVAAHA